MMAANDGVQTDALSVKPKVPWWYWLIAVLGVLWSLGGAMDYIMTQTRNDAYLSQIPQPLLDYFLNMPTWLEVFWALAVWGGLLGWLLMLFRSRFAVPAFIVSLLSMLVNFGYTVVDGGLALQAEHMGPGMAYGFTGLVIVGALFAVWYSRRMRSRGWLR